MTDPLVDRIARRITEAIHPDRIILFGSRAQGTARPESDVDLVVVYSGPKPARELRLEIHRLFARPDFSLDLFVMTPEELESQKRIANTLAREVTERGVIYYG